MIFYATDAKKKEFGYVHPRLYEILHKIEELFARKGNDILITSVLRKPGTIPGESNVHATGRAMDVVPKPRRVEFELQHMECIGIMDQVNACFPRSDKKPTCLYHAGTGWHFHLQVAPSSIWKDLKGEIPAPKTVQAPAPKPKTP